MFSGLPYVTLFVLLSFCDFLSFLSFLLSFFPLLLSPFSPFSPFSFLGSSLLFVGNSHTYQPKELGGIPGAFARLATAYAQDVSPACS